MTDTTTTNNLRAWAINDCETYAGRTAEEAVLKAMADTGVPMAELIDGAIEDIEEVSRSQFVYDEDGDPHKTTVGAILDEMDGAGFVCGTEC